jgi:hypothetical protein
VSEKQERIKGLAGIKGISERSQSRTAVKDQPPPTDAKFDAGRITAIPDSGLARRGDAAAHAPKAD